MFPPGKAGDAGRAEPGPPGENARPFGGAAVGVTVPDPPDEPGAVGSEVVDWKSVEREAFDRRYGRPAMEESDDLTSLDGRPLATSRFVSESESCGDCSGSFGVGVIRRVSSLRSGKAIGWGIRLLWAFVCASKAGDPLLIWSRW